jgi:hypothetical protein
MRITEVIKPIKAIQTKPPLTPAKARVHSLKQGVERSRQQLSAERERQRQQRENERRQKLQQQLTKL